MVMLFLSCPEKAGLGETFAAPDWSEIGAVHSGSALLGFCATAEG